MWLINANSKVNMIIWHCYSIYSQLYILSYKEASESVPKSVLAYEDTCLRSRSAQNCDLTLSIRSSVSLSQCAIRLMLHDSALTWNKMQSEMADFASNAASWRTKQNICVIFDSILFLGLCENISHSQNRKYITYRIAVGRGPSHGHR